MKWKKTAHVEINILFLSNSAEEMTYILFYRDLPDSKKKKDANTTISFCNKPVMGFELFTCPFRKNKIIRRKNQKTLMQNADLIHHKLHVTVS